MGTPSNRPTDRRRSSIAARAAAAAVAITLLAACGGDDGAEPEASTTAPAAGGAAGAEVAADGFAFVPPELTVAAGTTVTWTNADAALHTVVGSGLSGELAASGGTFEHTFDEAGSFPYACTIHPSMTGTITVT
jgi:plastocyanin